MTLYTITVLKNSDPKLFHRINEWICLVLSGFLLDMQVRLDLNVEKIVIHDSKNCRWYLNNSGVECQSSAQNRHKINYPFIRDTNFFPYYKILHC